MTLKANVLLNSNKDSKRKANVQVVIDDSFSVGGISVIEGSKGAFVAMPNFKKKDGEYKDISHPITKDAREEFNKVVMEAYEAKLAA